MRPRTTRRTGHGRVRRPLRQPQGDREVRDRDTAACPAPLRGQTAGVLTHDNLYRTEEARRHSEFRGSRPLTAAILDVSNPNRKKIYFLVGHGELSPDDVDPARGLSIARDQLRQRNLRRRGPRPVVGAEDAHRRVAPGHRLPHRPRTLPFEQELLRQYLGAGAGRLILFLAPGTQSGLKDLLMRLGRHCRTTTWSCDTGLRTA